MGTVDDYLSELEATDRDAIDRVYALARDEVPGCGAGPGLRHAGAGLPGKPLISVMRAKKHIGLYPFSPDAVSSVAADVEAVEGTGLDKGTIRFQPEHPAARGRRARDSCAVVGTRSTG